ncbi:LysR family transcriptional regulator [Pelagibius sp. Alg239-R121]|uniref:LysR family transcriptional regulator n=1 Tax=Pelagibius sp. Alg239-R121 TaxID=2993448 RepID=UPI0024A69453|nr:LysR family transcriptional regulator [Pelagibius sp. Alg239-R121]
MLPLTALRTFDLVARHGSFSKAARELNVTRPAVSKQIRKLEVLLGRQLVIRGRPSVTMTESGRQLASGLLQGFDLISATYQRAHEEQDGANSVRILVDCDFASSWLAKHIGGFLVENPGVAIEVVADRNGQLRRGENFSFRIFYGPAGHFNSGDLIEEELCDWVDIPLCTPDYAIEHMSDGKLLDTARFLIDRNYDPRNAWFAHSGVADPGPRVQVSKFNDTSMCLSAALSGSGITIGDSFMALEAIESGRLIAPFKLGLRSTERYVICRAARRSPSKVEARFQKWLSSEVDQYQASVESILMTQGVTVLSAR